MASGPSTFQVFYLITFIGVDNSVTETASTTWITSPAAGQTVTITAFSHFSVAAEAAHTLKQEWVGVQSTWTVGQGGADGRIPLPTRIYAATTSPSGPSATPTGQISSTASGSTTSAASPTSANRSQRQKDSISIGAAVGIGVGSAAAGVLLALFIAYFFMRRKPPRSKSSTPSDGSLSGSNNKLPQVPLAALVRNRDVPTLPPPIEHAELMRIFTTLSTMIQNHAYSFFSQGSGQAKRVSNPEAVEVVLGDYSPIITQEVIELLNGPQRVVGVRLLLGWAIMSNIDPRSAPETTLLPPEFIALLQTLTHNSNPDPTLLSKWRHLTGTLLAPNPTPNLTRLISLLDAILAPLASSSDNVLNRKSNLEQIVKLGAQNGYVLLTQPTGWRFDWTRREAGGLVVSPEMLQTGDERGGKIEIERGCGVGRVVRIGNDERIAREEV